MVGPLPGPCVCGSFSAPGCPYVRKYELNAKNPKYYYKCQISLKFDQQVLMDPNTSPITRMDKIAEVVSL